MNSYVHPYRVMRLSGINCSESGAKVTGTTMNRDPSALMPNGMASLWVVWIFMFHSGAADRLTAKINTSVLCALCVLV
ncbi:MAG: hypothetical protein M5U10_04405 [Candidatus Methanoperedens sp.]|uniref:hypothetical protein n=1 Tax=Candidatus Methanoperedens nitratireducens TaxID=1392998 RepID=UPI0012FF1B66|nr:hypothetical protein [Candidatus Methanoperedens nitroreducens]MDJ1421142.1 hypothetical protein [Candidatus Methanoperedens sp.]